MDELAPPAEVRTQLDQLEARDPRPSRPLLRALTTWGQLIDEIGEYRGSLTYEYLNDLGSRTLLSLWLDMAVEDDLAALLAWVLPIADELDNRFREKSQPDVDGLNWDSNRNNPNYWWLRRLPNDEGLLSDFRTRSPNRLHH